MQMTQKSRKSHQLCDPDDYEYDDKKSSLDPMDTTLIEQCRIQVMNMSLVIKKLIVAVMIAMKPVSILMMTLVESHQATTELA